MWHGDRGFQGRVEVRGRRSLSSLKALDGWLEKLTGDRGSANACRKEHCDACGAWYVSLRVVWLGQDLGIKRPEPISYRRPVPSDPPMPFGTIVWWKRVLDHGSWTLEGQKTISFWEICGTESSLRSVHRPVLMLI